MNKLIAAVVSLFVPSVDSALSSFTKTVKTLEKVAARHAARAAKSNDAIIAIQQRAEVEITKHDAIVRAAFLEQDRATSIASKIADVFGV